MECPLCLPGAGFQVAVRRILRSVEICSQTACKYEHPNGVVLNAGGPYPIALHLYVHRTFYQYNITIIRTWSLRDNKFPIVRFIRYYFDHITSQNHGLKSAPRGNNTC